MNLSPAEILVIAIVALVVLGPTRLPEAARQLGRGYRQLLNIKDDFTKTMEEAAAPVREVQKTFEDGMTEVQKGVDGVQKGIDGVKQQASYGFRDDANGTDTPADTNGSGTDTNGTDASADTNGSGTVDEADASDRDARSSATDAEDSPATDDALTTDDGSGSTGAGVVIDEPDDPDDVGASDADLDDEQDTIAIARAKRGVRPRPVLDDDDAWWERA